jgi:acyl transferase domain-containing protein/NADPH:quinone reductase-like Zn-dependent oxidoreductase/acyl carrier protein/enoyl-[acyl-carrier-protein] reductase (NADH)
MSKKRIAIIGCSSLLPGARPAEFWSDLLAGKDLVTEVPPDRWGQDTFLHPRKTHPGTSYTFAAGTIGDISGFDAEFFGISPREAAQMDPQQRILLELTWESLENAGIKPSTIRGSSCGVFIGIASVDYCFRFVEDMAAAESATATGTSNSIAANRISYALDLRGPSMAIDTACSSSLVAFHQACRSILSGDCTHAITGGISLHTHPYAFITFSKATMLSPQGRCNVFDASGDGYVRSEGAGVFILKDYEQAMRDGDRVLAIVANSAINSDGRKSGITVPNVNAQVALLEQAYAEAGIDPSEVDYIEAHGTGTAVGDPVETHALGIALGQRRDPNSPLLIGSVKSNIGHLEAASGAAGLIKALHCIQNRMIPATIHLENPNPGILFKDWNLQVPTTPTKLKADGRIVVGVNSFGFGGANAHVVLQSPEPSDSTKTVSTATKLPHTSKFLPILVSGKTVDALKQSAAEMAALVRNFASDATLHDIAWSTVFHRDWHAHRAMIMATDQLPLAAALETLANGETEPHSSDQGAALDQDGQVAFIYSGNGSQWEGMGRALLAEDATFRETISAIDALFVPLAGWSLTDEFAGINGSGRYALTEIAQPALFALQVGITNMLRQQGLNASAVAGNSVGEVAAAWASGALSMQQAVQVIFHRSQCQSRTRGHGQMTAVGLGEAAMQQVLKEIGVDDAVVIAGINSAQAVTVAGPTAALETLEKELATRKVFQKRLDLDYAFHSPAMDVIEDEVMNSLSGLDPGPANIAFHSSVTGEPVEGNVLNASYWWRNIREPVQFQKSITGIQKRGCRIFIKVGAHPVLRSYVQQILREADSPGIVIQTLMRNDGSLSRVWSALRQAAIAGAAIDWHCWFDHRGKFISLPTYPWQQSHFWHQSSSTSANRLQREKLHPLLGYRIDAGEWIWENEIDTQLYPWLGDHVVGDTTVLPGTAYAEMALAAAYFWQPGIYIEIERIDIRAPLILGKTQSRLLRCSIDPTDGSFSIRSRDPANDEEWTTHSTGRISSGSAGVRLLGAASAVNNAIPEFQESEHNQLTRAAGLAYGPAFRAIDGIWRDGETVYARFENPQSIIEDLPATRLHPALLDCAFQLIIELLHNSSETPEGNVYVPIGIEELTWQSGMGQPAMASATLLRRNPNTLCASFTLFNSAGKPIAHIQNARFQKIHTGSNPLERLSYLEYHQVASPHPASSARAPRRLVDQLQRQLDKAFSEMRLKRYSAEVEPLLDVLCARFSATTLRDMASDTGLLSGSIVHDITQRNPAFEPLLMHVIEMLCEDHSLREEGSDWRFTGNEDLPGPSVIWNSLLRDYPDYLPAIHAVGRVGMHLGNLIQGRLNPEYVLPRDCNPGTMAHQMLIDSGLPSARRSVVTAIQETLDELPAGARLRVLELCAGKPLFASHIATSINTDRCGYTVSVVGTAISEICTQIKEQFPALELRQIDPTQPLDTQSLPANQRYQMIIINPDFASEIDAKFAMNQARHWLAPRGAMLVLEQHRTRWLDFIFGINTQWWSGSADQGWSSRQKDAGYWRKNMQRLGLKPGKALEFSGEQGVGPYLLLGQSDYIETAQPELESNRNWLLFTDRENSAYSTRLARQVQDALKTRGDSIFTVTPASHFNVIDNQHYQLNSCDSAQVEALLAHLETKFGRIDGIVHLQGMMPPSTDLNSLLQMECQLDRCTAAAAIVKACAFMALDIPIWLLTSGVHRNPHPRGSQRHVRAPAMDAALWGLGRTAMNENAGSIIRLIDIDPAASIETISYLLKREFTKPDREQEIAFTATGERMALRLQLQQPPTAPTPEKFQSNYARLAIRTPGQLRNLQWQVCPLPAPSEDEIEIEVCAAGLNFRDVMYALGALTDDAVESGFAGPGLGLEFAGVVTRTGSDANGFKTGDRVLGFGANSFSNKLIARTTSIAPIPAGMSFSEAATIPSVFLTVHYALNRLARLEQGEKVLIHGAAGGIGLAAIQIAKLCGAEVFATAGSNEKRDFLRLLGIKHVFDSRSLAFADEILAATGGEGVDVVLNSLAGEAINRNLKVLRPFGRFLELGKRDFQENTRIGLRPFRNNISYFAVDADQLMKERPDLTAHLFRELMDMFNEGVLSPLPYVEFAANEAVSAFRYMQQSRHIGKIVINCRTKVHPVNLTPLRKHLELAPDATYLVTGGLRGFGLKSAEWLAAKGARNLVLLSRSGKISADAASTIARMRETGVEIHTAACDVADRKSLSRLLGEISVTMPPLRGIIHAAAIIEDSLIQNTDRHSMQRVWVPKIIGARNLHDITADRDLDFLVFYSSATTLFGNPGQASYVAANLWLENYAASLRLEGKNAFSVSWGAIADAGFLFRNSQIGEALNKRMGGAPITAASALDVLEQILLSGRSGLGVLELDWTALSRFLPAASTPKFSELRIGSDDFSGNEERRVDIHHLLATLSPADASATIAGMLKSEIGEILRIAPEKIDEHRILHDLGFDSLMGVELGTAVETRFAVRLPVLALNDAPTVAKLAIIILERLSGVDSQENLLQATAELDLMEQGRLIAAQYADNHTPPKAQQSLPETRPSSLTLSQRIIH